MNDFNIPLLLCGIFYAVLCIFSIVTGLMYASGRKKLNPLELSDSFLRRVSDRKAFAKKMGWVTFVVGIVQGITSYSILTAVFRHSGPVFYGIALGFTIFSICSVACKLKGKINAFPVLKCVAYVVILVILLSGGARRMFFEEKRAAEISIQAENEYMQAAVNEAIEGISRQHGGPFGCVIVRDGEIVAREHNRVVDSNDPTSHGEILALRAAGRSLGAFDLSGCELYTTGEPCPMCLCACLWAKIDRVYYGCTIEDNERIGFRDKALDEYFGGREAFQEYLSCMDREACLALYDAYLQMERTNY